MDNPALDPLQLSSQNFQTDFNVWMEPHGGHGHDRALLPENALHYNEFSYANVLQILAAKGVCRSARQHRIIRRRI